MQKMTMEIKLKVCIVVFDFLNKRRRINKTETSTYSSTSASVSEWGLRAFFHQSQLLLENEGCDSFEFCDEVLCP